jgi:RNA polymerase sigma-70 factor (ECF subfamily)
MRGVRIGRRVAAEVTGGAPDLGRAYREHAADVSRWARRLGGPGVDAEDVLHEVFVVAQRRLPEFRGEAKISTWLYAITLRVVQEARRKARWRRWLHLAPPSPGPPPATPLEAFESRRASEVTYRLLDQLPEAERGALILFELEGLSGEQIAALTGEAVGTIWVRLHRARARFRKAYVSWERRQGPAPLSTPAKEDES